MNANDFARRVRAYADKQVPLIAKEAKKAVGEALYEELVQNTPVLTGHARHNWRFGVGAPPSGEVDGVAGVSATRDPVTGDEQARIDEMKAQVDSSEVGDKLYVGNYTPYIVRLDAGSSAKAPEGIVDVSILSTIERVKARGFKLR